MREIKFRGKRVDNGEWVYGGLATYGEHAFIIITKLQISESDNIYFSTTGVEVDPSTVGQYIGKLDTKDKEIYKGDIVKSLNNLYLVYWDEHECAFKLDYRYFHHKGGDECHTYLPMYSRKGEVIGNIYDNPELLKE